MSDAQADAIDALARPLAEAAGLDLVEVELKGGGGRTRVRVIVDRKGGVDVGTCQQVSRQLAKQMDDADTMGEVRYTLEVTSPGTDRPLTDQRSFDRNEGRTVKVVLADGEDTTEVTGTIARAEDTAVVVVDEAGNERALPYTDIVKATQVLPW